MRVPLSWLAEFVDLAPGTTRDDVHAALVKVGLEEEDVHDFAISGPIVVGQVLEIVDEPQTNGKIIRWCQVRVAPDGQPAADGGNAIHGIVCGAHNFAVGDKVVVTLPGSVLPGPFPIAARKTYGHVSDGMIASVRELGIGDEHDGILVLSMMGLDPEIGTDALTLLGLDDEAVEINVTPDRGYALSIRGVAREYSHATGASFRDPAGHGAEQPSGNEGFPVSLADDAPIHGRPGCTVFATRIVRDIDVTRPSPSWMVARLKLAGIRSISLPVDISNYVMLELGQPIHTYDLDSLRGGITVRRARAGEKLTTLDDQTRTLHVEDLLITDERGAIGMAGVMGGLDTEITDNSRNILIEAANFDPISVARSARRHKLPSEASKRFERGVDPQIAVASASRVAQLLVDLAGGVADAAGSLIDESGAVSAITLPDGYVSGLIGVDYTAQEIRSSLAEIGGTIAESTSGLLVTPPSWRPDITDKCDLAEEVARIVGYERIPSVLPVAPAGHGLTRSQRIRRTVANTLAAAGSTEIVAFPFLPKEANDIFGSATETEVAQVKVANALDASAPYLRTSLLPGLIEAAKRNLSRGLTDLALFEQGLVFTPVAGVSYGQATLPSAAGRPSAEEIASLNAGIPPQPQHVAAILLGNVISKQPGQDAVPAGIADALVIVSQLGLAIGVTIEVVQGSHKAMHPGRTAELRVAGSTVGYAAELLPQLALDADLPRVVAVVELDLDAVIEATEPGVEATVIGTYPAATQDLTLLVDAERPASAILTAVREGAGELLEELRLVDDYRGHGVEPGQKALTLALRFRAADRTLTAAEASEAKLAGAARAAELLGASTRE